MACRQYSSPQIGNLRQGKGLPWRQDASMPHLLVGQSHQGVWRGIGRVGFNGLPAIFEPSHHSMRRPPVDVVLRFEKKLVSFAAPGAALSKLLSLARTQLQAEACRDFCCEVFLDGK